MLYIHPRALFSFCKRPMHFKWLDIWDDPLSLCLYHRIPAAMPPASVPVIRSASSVVFILRRSFLHIPFSRVSAAGLLASWSCCHVPAATTLIHHRRADNPFSPSTSQPQQPFLPSHFNKHIQPIFPPPTGSLLLAKTSSP